MPLSHLILFTASGLSHVFTIFQAAVNNYKKMLCEEDINAQEPPPFANRYRGLVCTA